MEYSIVDDSSLEVMMYPEEVEALTGIVDKLHHLAVLVEFGSGGSTQFFADRLCSHRSLISIEHNEEWYLRVVRALKEHPNRERVTSLFRPPDFPLERYVFAQPEEEMPAGLQNYINVDLPVSWNDVDFVLVDGVARGACLAALRTKLKPGTMVVLHDYTGRENWYDWAVNLYTRLAPPVGRAGLLPLQVPFPLPSHCA